jgi:hypothetical protein
MEINVEKTKYTLLFRHQTPGQSQTKTNKNKLPSLSTRANYYISTKQPQLAGKLVPTFEDGGCRAVSATDF